MGDAGASLTVPIRAGEVKKGMFVMLKQHPCKVIEVTTSKTGKHGHAKANITGLDIFTGNKYIDICPTSHNMTAPVVKVTEYDLIDINDEGYLTLLTDDGDTKEDLKLPKGDKGEELRKAFDDAGESDSSVVAAVTAAMGNEAVLNWKVIAN